MIGKLSKCKFHILNVKPSPSSFIPHRRNSSCLTPHSSRPNGFTLIEILVALVIFAIMGVLAALSLRNMIGAHASLKQSDRQILQLQITMTLLRRDIMQIIDRKILTADGSEAPALSASGNQLMFTRTGIINPLGIGRNSNMQRIGYSLDGNKLERLTWDVLDQTPKSKPESQVLLEGVQSLQWQFISDDGTKSSTWPSADAPQNTPQKPVSNLPKAVLMVMKLKNAGVIEGNFPVPAKGVEVAGMRDEG